MALRRKGAGRNGSDGFVRNGEMQSSEWEVEDGKRARGDLSQSLHRFVRQLDECLKNLLSRFGLHSSADLRRTLRRNGSVTPPEDRDNVSEFGVGILGW